jgi:hypothetical protein
MRNIIYQPWGGLGDNLAHSIIPELCNQAGIKCYLSKHNVYRNQEIHDFVWKLNPYIEEERLDSTDLSWLDMVKQYEVGKQNHIQVLQKIYGFDTNFEYPKIYYTPKYIDNFKNKVLIDLTAHSAMSFITPTGIQAILNQLNIDKENAVYVIHTKVKYSADVITLQDKIETVDINDLNYYSDVITSCKRFITLLSGQSVLASTLKHQTNSDVQIDVLTPAKCLPHPNYGYTFSNANHIETY